MIMRDDRIARWRNPNFCGVWCWHAFTDVDAHSMEEGHALSNGNFSLPQGFSYDIIIQSQDSWFEYLGITDKFSRPSSHICAVLSSSTNPRRSTATPVVCLLAEPSKSQVRRTQAIGQRLVCENVPRMQARSASHDWLTLTAIEPAHLCKSGRPHFISASSILSLPCSRREPQTIEEVFL